MLSPPYFIKHDMFSPAACDDVIECGIKLLSNNTNTMSETVGGLDLGIRDSTTVFFDEPDLYEKYWEAIQFVNQQTNWYIDLDHTERFQFTQYQETSHSANNQGQFYDWHQDSLSSPYIWFNSDNPIHQRFGAAVNETGQKLFIDQENKWNQLVGPYVHSRQWDGRTRKLSISVCLNEDYVGGEFQVYYIQSNEDHKPVAQIETIPLTKGAAIFFPSYTWHRVTPVTQGTRQSLVLWVLGAPWR